MDMVGVGDYLFPRIRTDLGSGNLGAGGLQISMGSQKPLQFQFQRRFWAKSFNTAWYSGKHMDLRA